MYFGAAIFRQLTTAQLQELCRRNGLSALGRRTTLENRLKNAGIASAAAPNDQPVSRQLPSTGLPVQQRANPNAFTEEQITDIKRLVEDLQPEKETLQRHRQGGRSYSHGSFAVTGTVFFTSDSISPGREPRYPRTEVPPF